MLGNRESGIQWSDIRGELLKPYLIPDT